MKFGPVPVEEAEGAILAHSLMVGGRRIRKSQKLTRGDIEDLKAAGIDEVAAAVLTPDDVDEDRAAAAIGAAMRMSEIESRPPATGRVNFHARKAGIFCVDAGLVDALNAVDPAITLATLPDMAPVRTGQMVATVKIIPYAVPAATVGHALDIAGAQQIFAVHPFRAARVSVVQTTLPSLKDSVLDKTLKVTAERLARSGSTVSRETRVAHETSAVADAIRETAGTSDLVVVFGASAVSDFEDVIPAAIQAAGGTVLRTGMPVDPGNLLVLGEIEGRPVIGAPGCARSPRENGFDWVLDRTLAGLQVTDRDIAGMGVGGLLMEIPTRPQPRERNPASSARPKVHTLILAAGRSSRMGGPNKLLAEFDGTPLVRQLAERASASAADGVTVVTGHQADRIEEAVVGLRIRTTRNKDFASGLSTSLKAGVAALPPDVDGALVVLGDMPGITRADLNRLIAAFRAQGGRSVVRATHNGKRGNPVILPRALFGAVAALQGDTGARHIVEAGGADIVDIELGATASMDVDTPEAMATAGGVLRG